MNIFKKLSKKAGMAPGSPVFVGEKKIEKPKITFLDYTVDYCEEKEVSTVEEVFELKVKSSTSWIDIKGLHEVELLGKIGTHFEIHPLVIEDILNTDHRPKIEDFGDYIFIITKMIEYDLESGKTITEQVSIILGKNYVITFQEKERDVFEPLRERIRKSSGRIRKLGNDYLTFAIMDSIVDNYYIILEQMGERIEAVEDELVKNPSEDILESIRSFKKEIISLRKSVWPLREVVNTILREESVLINESHHIYFRDVYDHIIQIIDSIETFRDVVSGLMDIYMSSISNKMNIVMKVLTIIATIFIPLTFIAGIYGMNFKFMPELEWRFGYFAVLAVMLVLGVIMLIFFKRKKWL